MWRRIGRKRLAMDISHEMHQRITETAKKRNITITKWVKRALYKQLLFEEQWISIK